MFERLCKISSFQEPVKDEEDIIKFCDETGLPVALDETINCIRENPSEVLEKYAHTGIVAVVSFSASFLWPLEFSLIKIFVSLNIYIYIYTQTIM